MTSIGECEKTLCAWTTRKCASGRKERVRSRTGVSRGSFSWRQPADQGLLGGEEDVRGDVEAVVVAGVEVLDEAPAAAQVAAADLQQVVPGPQAVAGEVVELEGAEGQPALVGLAADRGLGVEPPCRGA